MEKHNPFNPNSVVAPTLFAGRVAQISEICEKLAQLKYGSPSSFFVYGERGIGKTALAKVLKYISSINDKKLFGLNLLTSYYSVEKGQSLGSVLQESINKLTEGMDKSLLDEIGERVGNLFKNGKFEIGAFGVSLGMEKQESVLQREITIKDQAVSIISNVIRSINKKDENGKDGILLIIDEIHNLEQLSHAASVFRGIITSLDVDGLGKLSFLLIGYEDDKKEFFLEDSSARRTFDPVELGVMPEEEAVEVLVKGFISAELSFDEKPLKENIDVAGGYPHSIQILGQNLVRYDRDGKIDEEDWKMAIATAAFQLQEKDFASMYTFRKKQVERDKILVYLAKNSEKIDRKSLNDKNITSNTYRSLSELKGMGAIREDDQGNISLHSQLFRTAILFDIAYREIELGEKLSL